MARLCTLLSYLQRPPLPKSYLPLETSPTAPPSVPPLPSYSSAWHSSSLEDPYRDDDNDYRGRKVPQTRGRPLAHWERGRGPQGSQSPTPLKSWHWRTHPSKHPKHPPNVTIPPIPLIPITSHFTHPHLCHSPSISSCTSFLFWHLLQLDLQACSSVSKTVADGLSRYRTVKPASKLYFKWPSGLNPWNQMKCMLSNWVQAKVVYLHRGFFNSKNTLSQRTFTNN